MSLFQTVNMEMNLFKTEIFETLLFKSTIIKTTLLKKKKQILKFALFRTIIETSLF